MYQQSTSASFRLDTGHSHSFSIELIDAGFRLTIGGQELVCADGDLVLSRVLEVTGPLEGEEAEDVRNLVAHQLTCLEYFGGPKQSR